MENTVIDTGMSEGSMSITPEIKSFLSETAKWAKFLAIIGFVGIGFMVLFGLFFSTFMASMSGLGGAEAGMGIIMSIFYLAFAALYFFPTLWLFKFATKMKTALANDNQSFLRESFQNLKKCYQFIGILMAIVLGLYAVGIVIGLLFGGMAAFM
jgi:hypothetical protein